MPSRTPLTADQKERVKAWLRAKNPVLCPFLKHYGKRIPECESICKLYFPRIDVKESCPCYYYSLNTILNRAREMVRE
jgi:hypothetical protein